MTSLTFRSPLTKMRTWDKRMTQIRETCKIGTKQNLLLSQPTHNLQHQASKQSLGNSESPASFRVSSGI